MADCNRYSTKQYDCCNRFLSTDLQASRSAFTAQVAPAYQVEYTADYIDSSSDIVDQIEGGLNKYLFGDSSTSTYESAGWDEYGFQAAGAAMSGDAGVTSGGDVDDKTWIWDFGIGECLDGDVQVVMGGKNGRN